MVNRAHNLQIVQVQLQNCNYFTNSAILFTKNARKIAFQLNDNLTVIKM